MMAYGRDRLKPKTAKLNATGVPSEHSEQVKLAVWLDRRGLLYTASANGGVRNQVAAFKLKQSGVKKGHPDIAIYEPVGKYHGMMIELKPLKGGVLTEMQFYWLEALTKKGYYAIRCNGKDAAVEAIEEYLSGACK